MKSSARNLLVYVALAAVCFSPVASGIRSSTSSLSSMQGSDQTLKSLLLKTRGGSILPPDMSGGDLESSDDDVEEGAVETEVAEVPPPPAPAKSSKWRDLTSRVLSAVGMIGFLAGLSVYFKEDGLSVLVVILQFMMYGEITRTIGGDDWGSKGATIRKYWWFLTAVVALDLPRVIPWNRVYLEASAFSMAILVGVVGSVLRFQALGSGTAEFRENIRQAAVSLVSATLVVLPSSYWIGTLEEHGMKWIFVPAALVAINDIMAYVFGRLMGKHPLLPSISPKKTWEGFLGAALSTVGAAWVGLADEGSQPLFGPGLPGISREDGLVVAVVASTIAPFAGFLASVIKRAYGRKDFGDFFPGHGGFVDRLDCQLILAPFVYFYLSLYKAAASS